MAFLKQDGEPSKSAVLMTIAIIASGGLILMLMIVTIIFVAQGELNPDNLPSYLQSLAAVLVAIAGMIYAAGKQYAGDRDSKANLAKALAESAPITSTTERDKPQ